MAATAETPLLRGAVLWVGGSSGLAFTFVDERLGPLEGERIILTGVEKSAPAWVEQVSGWSRGVLAYVQLDLTSVTSVATLFDRIPFAVASLVIGARLPLVGTDDHTPLLAHLSALVEAAAERGVERVLHISSVAAVDHLRSQVGVCEMDPLPPLDEYRGSYDLFKRQSEEEISRACMSGRKLAHSHVRLSAIFSNDPWCIQVNALASQARVGSYLPVRIDCNSSRNVGVALKLILARLEAAPSTTARLYYYTRPLSPPVPYGEHVRAYREAHSIFLAVWLPAFLVAGFVALVHVLVAHTWLRHVGRLRAIDYLLQVSSRDHTFDNRRIHADFPELAAREESASAALARIRERQSVLLRRG